MTINSYISAAALACICFYVAVRLRYELQMLQQNSYRISRYWRWIRTNAAAGLVDLVTNILMVGILYGFYHNRWAAYAIGAVGLVSLYKGVKLLRVKYKKPLVFTARATRLYAVALLIVAVMALPLTFIANVWAAQMALLMVTAAPFVMMLAVVLLMPVEAAVNRWYINDARRILAEMPNLKIIGVTGSYGKTSTKHYLHRILSERFSVVMTPGSFNTTLGVVRAVREHLKPYTEVFIVEMGAKQRGDIAEICELSHPSIGVITAVGEQHLESFKTMENVQRAKFELVDSLPPDGVAILNDDFEYIASRPVANVAQVFRYTSTDKKADYRIADVKYGRDETSFAIEYPDGGKSAPFSTRLVGIHNLSNILAGYIAGKALGMTDDDMRYAIASIEQVEHRLDIRRTPGGVTIIDDAFNSNPHGAAMALDVLKGFGGGGRRIVVTPGMIELGEKQERCNRELGRQIATACDIAVVVGEYNREAILTGLAEEGFPAEKIFTASDFADASRYVGGTMRAGDAILYENDLPDTFK